MNDLPWHLERMVRFVQQCTPPPPHWSSILIAEAAHVTYGEVITIPRSALATPEQYANRFEAHLGAGHSWINMNCAGIVDDALLVIIELPSHKNSVPRERVSVNLSGPTHQVAKAGWGASGHIKFTD